MAKLSNDEQKLVKLLKKAVKEGDLDEALTNYMLLALAAEERADNPFQLSSTAMLQLIDSLIKLKEAGKSVTELDLLSRLRTQVEAGKTDSKKKPIKKSL